MSQGKRHNHALIAPVRRHCNFLFAMMHDGTLYCHKHARQHSCPLLFFLANFYPS
ncbi:hypothetical protein G3P90_005407 [Escherichia coli]|nr:hypothetical protein [Escherichia coli]EFI9179798.1 hypothetical protein [Escherichia coli]EFJ0062350.1 hypothetical protein [Escherichia coli]